MNKFTTRQVFVLVLSIVAGIAFMETSAPVLTAVFWREFLLKFLGYGAVSGFVVIGLATWTNRFKDRDDG